MAQRVNVVLVDDIDESEAVESVKFGLDGTDYEIDLNEEHAAELREALAVFIESGRRVGGRSTRKKVAAAASNGNGHVEATAAEIREWARSAGYEVTDRGRVSAELREAYRQAN